MRLIDVHQHLWMGTRYPEDLLREMDALGIEKCCLAPLGPAFEEPYQMMPWTEEEVLPLLRRHPDRLLGYAFIRLGADTVEKARRWHEQGFFGLKFMVPLGPYDREEFFPVYAYAEERRLPCLFHSGIFASLPMLKGQRAAVKDSHPDHIEVVANEFPDLKIIIAHLGVAYAEVTCTLLRCRRNVYADISGRLDGWRSSKPPAWFQEMLYWPGAADKLLFGSDCHIAEMKDALESQRRVIGEFLGWDEAQMKKFLSVNARRLFDLPLD